MADLKITQLVQDTTPAAVDFLTSVKSPFGPGSNRKVQVSDLFLNAPDTQITGGLGINTAPNSPFGILDVGSIYCLGEMYEFDKIASPATVATATLSGAAGNIDNGTHAYVFAYGTTGGYNTQRGSNPSNTITVVDKTIDGQVSLTSIPQSLNPEVNQIFIFRDNNGDGIYKFVDQILAGVTTYVDNKANASLGVVAPTINSTGIFVVDGDFTTKARVHGASASISSANDLILGMANQNLVSGTTTINAISIDGWSDGDVITLIFSGVLTVKNNTAGGGGTARIFLAGSTDLVTAANTVLGLTYDGSQWQETFRKVA